MRCVKYCSPFFTWMNADYAGDFRQGYSYHRVGNMLILRFIEETLS